MRLASVREAIFAVAVALLNAENQKDRRADLGCGALRSYKQDSNESTRRRGIYLVK